VQYLRSYLPHLAFLACVVAALGTFTVFGKNGFSRLTELRAYKRSLTDQAFRLCQANEKLRERITRFHGDDHYLEALARSRLGLVRDREMIYRFSDWNDADSWSHPPGSSGEWPNVTEVRGGY
jgi:cell division protein FtsB